MVVELYLSKVREHAFLKLKHRFWRKVFKTESCWVWAGSKNQNGCGLFRVGKRTSGAPRVAWELTNGPIPDTFLVCHRCDNPTCVNPAHLWLGTHKENMADRDAKGRCVSWHSSKTHCPKGHPYSGDNLRVDRRGTRSCRACCRYNERERLRRNRDRLKKSLDA